MANQPVPNLAEGAENCYVPVFTISQAPQSDSHDENVLPGVALLKPYLTYLKMFGLYFDDLDRSSFWKHYCRLNVGVYVVLFIWMVITSAMFVNFDEDFQNSAMFLIQGIWMLQNCCIAFNCYRISRGGRFQLGFIKEWEMVYAKAEVQEEIVQFARKSQKIIIYLVAVIQAVNVIIFIAVDFELIAGAGLFPAGKHLPPAISPICQRIAGILSAVSVSPWVIGKCLFIVVCLNMNKLIRIYNRELRGAVYRKGGISGSQIESLRLRHIRLSRLVETVEEHFSFFVFATYLTNLGMIVANTNAMLDTNTLNFETILGFIWVICDLVVLGAMSLVGAQTNGLAHKCLEDLKIIRTNSMSSKNGLQLSLFMTKISQTTIGISGYGFFVLSKHFLANALSAYVSYYFLLVQLKPAKNALDVGEDNLSPVV